MRWDGGYEPGDEVSQYYDNLVGKLIVWGADRDIAIDRMLRALREFEIDGIATTIPADIAILEHPDFEAATHSTKWVEDDARPVRGRRGPGRSPPTADEAEAKVQRDVDVEVNGKRFSVSVWVPESGAPRRPAAGARRPERPVPAAAAAGAGGAGGGTGAVTRARCRARS